MTDHGKTPRRDDHPGDGVSRGTARMEAFADAVFAIAFTLPVVEIALPDDGEHLWAGLAALWPSYVGYAIAALVIGTYWSHHHFTGAIYRTTGHWFNLATVLFLAAIGIIAFPARVFAEHLPDAAGRPAAAQFFVCCLAASSLAWLLKWTIGRVSGHVDDRLEPAYVARLNRMYLATTALFVAAAVLVFLWWQAGMALAALITCFYLIPPKTPDYREEAPIVEGEG